MSATLHSVEEARRRRADAERGFLARVDALSVHLGAWARRRLALGLSVEAIRAEMVDSVTADEARS